MRSSRSDIRNDRNNEEIEREIKALKELDNQFGEFVYSEFKVVMLENTPVISDWALIKVHEPHVGINYVRSDIFSDNRKRAWIPRDSRGIYLSGFDSLACGLEVSKRGRATGAAVGRINLQYSYVNLETPSYTTEYTIISKSPMRRFSQPGDSGSPVFDIGGAVCGMVIAGSNDQGTILIRESDEERKILT